MYYGTISPDNIPEVEILKCDGQDTCSDTFHTRDGFCVGDPCPTETCTGKLRAATPEELYEMSIPEVD